MTRFLLALFYLLPSKLRTPIRERILLALNPTENDLQSQNASGWRNRVNGIKKALRQKIDTTVMSNSPMQMNDSNIVNQLATLNQINSIRLYREILSEPKYADPRRLERFGRKFYSQNEEDGMIEEIFRRIGTANKMFLEFGVANGLENNTLLLTYRGWKGVWLDGGAENIDFIHKKFRPLIASGALHAKKTWITAESIDATIRELQLPVDLDLISIDIDGNDYYVLENIACIKPRVIVIEFNSKLPPPIKAVIKYDPDFFWEGDYSDYFGCSLAALTELAERKGYQLVGVNITGCNAFFVRKDLCEDKFYLPASAEALYNPPRYEILAAGAFKVGHTSSYGRWEITSE